MHMQGEPQTMQANPTYESAALDIYRYLAAQLAACAAAGIDPARVVVDPGIGFGKSLAHNLQLFEQLALFQGLGCAVLLGASRKARSEEHTSELQSLMRISYAVFCLKKKKK